MFKIFCIPESQYISAFYQYTKEAEYDGDRIRSEVLRTSLRPMMVTNGQHPIVHDMREPIHLRYDKRFYLKQDRMFTSYHEVECFAREAFSDVFIFTFKDGQFASDMPHFYANPPEFNLPVSCFEIHEFDSTGKVIGMAPLCVCIPTKASK